MPPTSASGITAFAVLAILPSCLAGCGGSSTPAPASPNAAAAAPSEAKPGGTGKNRVKLAFSWQPGLKMQVEDHAFEQAHEDEAIDVRTKLTLTVAGNDQGLSISPSDITPIDAFKPVEAKDPDAFMQALAPRLAASLYPALTVSPKGELVEVESPAAAIKQAVSDALASLPPEKEKPGKGKPEKGKPSKEELREMLSGAMGSMMGPMLQMRATREWAELVGLWAGRELEEGESLAVDDKLKLGMLGEVSAVSRLTFRGYVPCHEKADPSSCVKLTLETELSPEQGEHKDMAITKLHQLRELITEPATLRPHSTSYTSESVVRMELGSAVVDSKTNAKGDRRYVYAAQ